MTKDSQMAERIVVHIGDSKTGSTALQVALRQAARDENLLFPGEALNHNGLARALSRRKLSHLFEPRFRAVWDEISASSAQIAALSAELFQAVPPSDLLRAIEMFWPAPRPPMSFHAYCRPHISRLVAMYSERIKVGKPVGTIDAYAARICRGRRLDYAPRFAEWERVFAPHFHLRPYPARGDVVADFFAQALPGVPPPAGGERLNATLTAAQVSLLQRVPSLAQSMNITHPLSSQTHRLICMKLRQSGVGASSPLPRMSADLVRRVQNRFAEDARKMDRYFFGGTLFQNALRDAVASDQQDEMEPLRRSDIDKFDTMARAILEEAHGDPQGHHNRAQEELRRVLP